MLFIGDLINIGMSRSQRAGAVGVQIGKGKIGELVGDLAQGLVPLGGGDDDQVYTAVDYSAQGVRCSGILHLLQHGILCAHFFGRIFHAGVDYVGERLRAQGTAHDKGIFQRLLRGAGSAGGRRRAGAAARRGAAAGLRRPQAARERESAAAKKSATNFFIFSSLELLFYFILVRSADRITWSRSSRAGT